MFRQGLSLLKFRFLSTPGLFGKVPRVTLHFPILRFHQIAHVLFPEQIIALMIVI
jgi:hypothetical protein